MRSYRATQLSAGARGRVEGGSGGPSTQRGSRRAGRLARVREQQRARGIWRVNAGDVRGGQAAARVGPDGTGRGNLDLDLPILREITGLVGTTGPPGRYYRVGR